MCRPPLKSRRLVVFLRVFYSIGREHSGGAGSTREVWGDPSPCMGPAARDMDGHAGGQRCHAC